MNVGSARRYLPVGVTARRKLRRFYSNEGRKSSMCLAEKEGATTTTTTTIKGERRKRKEKRKGIVAVRYVHDKFFSLRDI